MKKTKLVIVIGIVFLAAMGVVSLVQSVQAGQTAVTITVSTNADVLNGDDGLCSLREAVYAANNNVPFGGAAGECAAGTDADTDIITLADGETYTLSINGVDEDNTTTGDLDILDNTAALDVMFTVANNGSATIDADDIDRVLHIEDAAVELNKIALANGNASPGSDKIGGGVLNNNGTLTMNDGEVRSGNAVTGGGIYNYSGSPTGGQVNLNGTQVILNGAGVFGGIFSGGDNARVRLDGAIIRANNTNSMGGGIGILGGNLDIFDTTISLNSAQTNGGGIHADGAATITITNTLIEANEATGVDAKGGGIYLADNETQANTTIQNSIIKDNTAVVSGGGLFGLFDPPHNGKVIIENSDFRGNQASASGAIYTVRAHISGSLFDDNHATVGDAGAVFIPSLVLTDTVFTNNTAADDAGAIFGQGLIATNIRVENNEALDSGGGVYFIGTGTKDISNSMVLSNTAATGGGIYISGSDGTRSHISQTAVAYNKASSDGGGIYANESALSMSNSTISTNQANSSGGGFYIDASSIITATNITVALNMLGQDIFKEGELTLQNSIIHTPDTPNCNFVVTPINSLGHNLTDDASCDGLNQTGDEINPDVGLAPLADNGGNTLTHALLDGSPALDSGNAAACAAAPVNNVDQRGILRTIGASCDKGAFERGAVVYLPVIIR